MNAVLEMSQTDDAFSITKTQINAGTWRRVVLGAGLLVLLFGAGGLWMATAPLNAAATAPGMVSVDSQNKTIHHLEGGILKAIMVEQGTKVQTGQDLVHLA